MKFSGESHTVPEPKPERDFVYEWELVTHHSDKKQEAHRYEMNKRYKKRLAKMAMKSSASLKNPRKRNWADLYTEDIASDSGTSGGEAQIGFPSMPTFNVKHEIPSEISLSKETLSQLVELARNLPREVNVGKETLDSIDRIGELIPDNVKIDDATLKGLQQIGESLPREFNLGERTLRGLERVGESIPDNIRIEETTLKGLQRVGQSIPREFNIGNKTLKGLKAVGDSIPTEFRVGPDTLEQLSKLIDNGINIKHEISLGAGAEQTIFSTKKFLFKLVLLCFQLRSGMDRTQKMLAVAAFFADYLDPVWVIRLKDSLGALWSTQVPTDHGGSTVGVYGGTTQVDVDEGDVRNIFHAFSASISSAIFGSDLQLKQTAARIDAFTKIARGMNNLSDWLFKLVKLLMEYFCEDADDLLYKDYYAYCAEAGKVLSYDLAEMNKRNPQKLVGELQKLYSTGISLINDSAHRNVPRKITAALQILHRDVTGKLRALAPAMFNGKYRCPPFSIFLHGAPACGKTSAIPDIARAIYDRVNRGINTFDPSKEMFAPTCGSDFWEGYHNQRVVILDDVGQIREEKAYLDEITKVFTLVNSSPLALNMATLELKGQVQFTSDMLFATSNKPPAAEMKALMSSPEAYISRFAIIAHVTTPRATVENRFDQMRFDVTCNDRGRGVFQEPIGEEPMDFTDFCDAAAARYIIFKKDFERACESFESEITATRETKKSKFAHINEHWFPEPTPLVNAYDEIPSTGINGGETQMDPNSAEYREVMRSVHEFDCSIPETHAPVLTEEEGERIINDIKEATFYDLDGEPPLANDEDTEFRGVRFETKATPWYNDLIGRAMREGDMFFTLPVAQLQVQRLVDLLDGAVEWVKRKHPYLTTCLYIASNVVALLGVIYLGYRLFKGTAKKCGFYRPKKKRIESPSESEPPSDREIDTEGCTLPLEQIDSIDMVRAAKKKSDKKSESFYNDQETKRHKKPAKAVKLSEGPKIKFKVKKNLPVEQEVVEVEKPIKPESSEIITFEEYQKRKQLTTVSEGAESSWVDDEPPGYLTPISECLMEKVTDSTPIRLIKRIPDVEKLLSDTEAVAEASIDPLTISFMRSTLVKNRVAIYSAADSPTPTIGGLFISDQIMVLPYHYFSATNQTHFYIQTNLAMDKGVRLKVDINDKRTKSIEDPSKDIVWVSVPNIHSFRDISKHFVSERKLTNLKTLFYSASACTQFATNLPGILNCTKMRHITKEHGPISYYLPDKSKGFHIIDGWQYSAETLPGDCGSPVCLHSNNSASILGFHVSGTAQGQGYCNSMSQDYVIKKVKELRGCFVQSICGDVVVDAGKGIITLDDNTDYLGEVPSPDQFRNPSKTAIAPSPFNGKLRWEPTTKPAHLTRFVKDGEVVNPMRKAIAKQFEPAIPFDPDILEMAKSDFQDLVLSQSSKYKFQQNKILDEYVNLNGIDGDEYMSGMNLRTSPGYPYTKHKLFDSDERKNKFGFLEEVSEDRFMLKPEIREIIEEKEAAMMQGIIPPFVWTDNSKDERLPIDKVDDGKVRVFNCGPLDLNFLTRKYFSFFIAHCMHNNTSEVSCGIDAHSAAWHVLYKRVTKHGKDRIIAGDYSSYDKRLPFDVIMKLLDVIQAFYNDEFYMIRRSIFIATFNAVHLCGRSLYRCFRGNPSGTPLTTIVNCCVNAMLFRYAYMYMAIERDLSPYDFRRHVEFASFGDDNLSGVCVSVPWFNALSFKNVMSKYNIDYTSSCKGLITVEYESIDDVTYLKRSFVLRDGWMYAPLAKASIHEMMQWCKPSNIEMSEIMQSTFNSFCTEIMHYGRNEYDDYVDHVMSVVSELDSGIELTRNDYQTLLKRMIQQSY
jgi:predicted DNA-binding antitoxin AbrB/MazE fold protein